MRLKVLVLSQRLPYAPNRGDRLRVYHMLRHVAAYADVSVAALAHDTEEEAHAVDLHPFASEVLTARIPRFRTAAAAGYALLGSTPLTHALLDSPRMPAVLRGLVHRRRPDVTLAFCSSMARFAMAAPLDEVPFVLDMIDADSVKWAALAEASRPPKRWVFAREAHVLGRFERAAMARAFVTLVVNQKERLALDQVAPGGRLQIMENGVDLEAFAPPAAVPGGGTVVFSGVMNYQPNAQGAVWLAREVWPMVRARRPDARLVLVGASPGPAVKALASAALRIEVTGSVADVRPYLWQAAVAAAPLQVARGIQNKVLEAVAAGLPCVVTPAVADGLPVEVTPACRVGETAAQFAAALTDLLGRAELEGRWVTRVADLSSLGWSARLSPLVPLLEAAARTGRQESDVINR